MKRFTYWPQLFLGITFNWGIVMAWTSLNNDISSEIIALYLSAIFWTLAYDTIYGFQDIKDDEIIGIKSTSIKFKKNPKLFLLLCYSVFIVSLFTLGILMSFSYIFYFFMLLLIAHLFFYQIYNFNFQSPKSCLKIFKSNNFLGFMILINLIIGKTLI